MNYNQTIKKIVYFFGVLLFKQNSYSQQNTNPTSVCNIKTLVNLGASFTHGCASCDASEKLFNENLATNDEHWFRRSLPSEFIAAQALPEEEVFVFENEVGRRPLASFSDTHIQTHGVTGAWSFVPSKQEFFPFSSEFLTKILKNNKHLNKIVNFVGGSETKYDRTPRLSAKKGHVFALGKFKNNNLEIGNITQLPEPRLVSFDLAQDGARLETMFKNHISSEIYKPLISSAWTNNYLREKAIQALAARILELKPDAVSLVDMFFWDTFSRSFVLLNEDELKSPFLKIALSYLKSNPEKKQMFENDMSNRIRDDFMLALREVSKHSTVYLGKLIDNAKDKFTEANYGPIAAALVVKFLEFSIDSEKLKQIIAKGILKEISKDISPIVQALADSMDEMNAFVRYSSELSLQNTSEKLVVISGESFLMNVGKYLKVETLHPSVYGAQNMNQIFTEQIKNNCPKKENL
jgi:hypothetical protein